MYASILSLSGNHLGLDSIKMHRLYLHGILGVSADNEAGKKHEGEHLKR